MISIIIPTLNESGNIRSLISYLKSCDGSDETEIIIADGGSTDGTTEGGPGLGVKVVECPQKGRAFQMNYGAEKASGDIFYFLHADSVPPKDFITKINGYISPKIKAGCFRLAFDHDHYLLSTYSWFTRFDVDFFRFGDQSLFVTGELFSLVGGFDERLLVMEDQNMVRRLKKHSGFIVSDQQVRTSARKYLKVGIVKLQLIFTAILGMYYIGVPQEKLVNFYKKHV